MSARESAEQQSPDGVAGFGGVTDGLHAIRPLIGTLHMVWPLMLEAATVSNTTTRAKALTLLSSNPISSLHTSMLLFSLGLWIFGEGVLMDL